jgi:hypothetical protein
MKEINENNALIIFPGAGNPSQQLYAKVYGLIEQGALEYGYKSVDLSIRWPGQTRGAVGSAASLNFRSAVETAVNHLRKYESANTPYDILGRSLGTYVALKSASLLRLGYLRRLILWGVPPFWRMWELYVRDLDATRKVGKSKGVIVGGSLFPSLEPVEPLLGGVPYPVVIASGTKDVYSTPADISYFRALTLSKHIQFRPPVHDAPHEVTDEHPPNLVGEYFRVLFQ